MARTAQLSYRVDRRKWSFTPGIASEFIHHLPDVLTEDAPPVVLIGRVTTQKQERNGNLREQVAEELTALSELGITPVAVFQGVENGQIHHPRPLLQRALACARGHRAIVLFAERDRAIRSASFDGTKESDIPTIRELMDLVSEADGVPIATRHHPDADGRTWQIKRGQAAKGNKGGRPAAIAPGYKKRRREELLPRAIDLSNHGASIREIAKALNASHSTIQGWISGCTVLQNPPPVPMAMKQRIPGP